MRLFPISLALLCAPASAQEILLQDGLNGDCYSIDVRTGNASLIGGPNQFLTIWSGLAMDSTGTVVTVAYNFQQAGVSNLYELDPSDGSVSHMVAVPEDGISALAFGPSDVLYAIVNIDYPIDPNRHWLFSIDSQTGAVVPIGSTGLESVLALDWDGTEMYLWDATKGLHTIDLQTAQVTDVNPSFLGSIDPSKSMCFSDNGTLYAFDVGLWTMEPTTGVGNFSGITWTNISGGMEYIPGPNQVLSLWQTEEVGNPTKLKMKGATPNGQVAIFLSDGQDGTKTIPAGFPCAGTILDLHPDNLRLSRLANADAQGEVVLGPTVLPAGARGDLRIQALDLTTCVKSNRIEVVW